MNRSMRRVIPALLVAISAATATTSAQAPAGRGQGAGRGAAAAQAVPAAPAEPLSALAPENLNKPRPKPPFDLTGNWFIQAACRGGCSAARPTSCRS